MSLYYDILKSPIGNLYVIMKDNKVVNIDIGKDNFDRNCKIHIKKYNREIKRNKELLKPVIDQLKDYFNGNIRQFNIDFEVNGTEFQKSVYNALLKIPYGEIRTYGYIANSINNEKSARAIGQACKNNAIPIIIPCHRVVGKNNKLGGYMGSHTNLKEILLNLEKK